MKNFSALFTLLFVFFSVTAATAQQYKLSSPDGRLQVQINNSDALHFSVQKNGQVLIPAVTAALSLNNGRVLGENGKVQRSKNISTNKTITPAVAIKSSSIKDHYNQLTLQFRGRFDVVFRAYNDAAAYRFKTYFPDSIIVKDEHCNITLPQKAEAWFSFTGRWTNNYEHLYDKEPADSLVPGKTTQLPLLIDLHENGKVLITESDLYDYPGLYFTGNGKNRLTAVFPPERKAGDKVVNDNDDRETSLQQPDVYGYISKTSGSRTFPWRIFAVADKDIQLLDNTIVYKLGKPNQLKDVSWIRPGQAAWDWWNDWNITGVDFKAGINTSTYKYYIDFAARNHIPYLVIDNGWYESGDLTRVNPDINMQELTRYADQKKVGMILWCSWTVLDSQMQKAMDLFQKWGIKGIKVDYMNRDDADVVNFYWRCAKAAAAHHLIVDFHGSHKPAGLQRTYPNVVNFEGVLGLEQDKWSDKNATPGMAVTIPYIRMFAGPLDYTPGAMRNAQKKDFRHIRHYPMSQGTRCQQLAMFVLYDAPLQMLSDNPTIYEKNKACLDFITSVPTTWDQTIPLAGEVGKYIAMARRKGHEYFAAAMTDWNARDLTLDLSFLPEGRWHIIIFKDGINADRNGTDFKKAESAVTNKSRLKIHLAPGGGWAARIYK